MGQYKNDVPGILRFVIARQTITSKAKENGGFDIRNKYVLVHLAIGNSAWNLIGADRLIVGTFAHTKEEADKDEGQRDEEPEREDTENGGEGHRRG